MDDTLAAVDEILLAVDHTTVAANHTLVAVDHTIVEVDDTLIAVDDTLLVVDDTSVTVNHTTVTVDDTLIAVDDTLVVVDNIFVAVLMFYLWPCNRHLTTLMSCVQSEVTSCGDKAIQLVDLLVRTSVKLSYKCVDEPHHATTVRPAFCSRSRTSRNSVQIYRFLHTMIRFACRN